MTGLDEPFFHRALLAAVGTALFAGPLGCFIVWRRMAYFGDTMAHSALLGVALGLLFGIDLTLGVMAITLLVAIALIALQHTGRLASDTLLGILSHTTLSLGLVAVGLMSWLRIDLYAYLFGDVLSVGWGDVAVVWGGAALVFVALAVIWRPLLAVTIDEDLARAEGVPAFAVRLAFTALLATVIALAMKIVGILLITSLLIIPAAAARPLAGSPEAMAGIAAVIGMVAAVSGLLASLSFDTPAGPSIVVAAATIFAFSLAATMLWQSRKSATPE